jgi:F-type H+-transporting ATPase subunit c
MKLIARQPEAAGKIQIAMIIIGALEGLGIGALILGQ